MEIRNFESFLSYYKKTREVTVKVIGVIPPDKMEWRYIPGKFTIADIVRHIAAIERHVFAETAKGNRPNYNGCGKELADGHHQVISYFNEQHLQSIEIFSSLDDRVLENTIQSVDGAEIKLGNFLRALILHEIHHRAVLCIYLNLLGVETPSIIGLKEEQVIQLCKQNQ